MRTRNFRWTRAWLWAATLGTALCLMPPALAVGLSLRVQLVWGTDDAKPKEAKYEVLEANTRDKLARVFKWKNYFVIHQQKVSLAPRGGSKRLRLSSKCEIELKYVDDGTLEIKLFGEGKWTKTVRQSVKAFNQGELAVLAGDDKEHYNDAWFVVLAAVSP
jgi:hypothetical protein